MNVVLLLVFVYQTLATSNDPCGSFYNYACRENNQGRDDDTGHVAKRKELREKVSEAVATEMPSFEEGFNAIIARRSDLRENVFREAHCPNEQTTPCDSYNFVMQEMSQYCKTKILNRYAMGPESHRKKKFISISAYNLFETDEEIQSLITTTANRIDQNLVPVEQRNFVKNTVFPDIRETMKSILQDLPESPQKQEILRRLDTVKINTPNCRISTSILDLHAAYEPVNYSISMCLSMLFHNDSLFSITYVLAHELAHSIDPVNSDIRTHETFSGLTQCLSRPRNMDIARNQVAMGEAFSDWMANEVMARMTQRNGHPLNRNTNEMALGLANAFPFCEFSNHHDQVRTEPGARHPIERDRIELITTQPKLRDRMGCTNTAQQTYCPLNGLPENSENPPPLEGSGVAQ